VTGNITNLQNSTGTPLAYGLNMGGTIMTNAPSYTGGASFTTPGGAPLGTTTSAGMSGSFYGAQAAETAGALRVEGVPTTAPVAVVGAFGAKR
jgi:hypothetical protein